MDPEQLQALIDAEQATKAEEATAEAAYRDAVNNDQVDAGTIAIAKSRYDDARQESRDASRAVLAAKRTLATQKPATPTRGSEFQDPHTGAISLLDPVTGAKKEISGPIPGWVAGRGVPAPERLQQPPQRAPRYAEEVELAQLQIEKARQDLLPQQALLLQNHFKTIDTLEQQLQSKQITPEEASRYMEQARGYLDAALRGTTPWQQEQEQRKRKEFEQGLGRDILNQRLASSSSLASALTGQATSALGGGAIIPRGERVSYNPMASAQGFADEAQGGPQVTDFARSLLTGTRSPTPGLPPAGVTGLPPGMGLPPDVTPSSAPSIGPGSAPGAANGATQPGSIETLLSQYPALTREDVLQLYPGLGG